MRKKWIKRLFVALATVCCLLGVACSGITSSSSGKPGETQTCVLNELELSVGVDESFTLQVLGNDLNLAVDWTTSNANIATVENGTVVGVAPGEVKITAKVGEQTLTCEVSVGFVYENAVYVGLENELETENGYALNLLQGSTYTLAPSLMDGEKVEGVTFTLTSASSAITVDGLTITAVSAVEKAEVVISCTYQETTYCLTVLVTVA